MKKQLIWLLSSRGWVKNVRNSLLCGWADLSPRRSRKNKRETWRRERKDDAVCGLDLWEMTLHLSATFPSEVPASTGLPGWTHLSVRTGMALLVSQPGVWAHCPLGLLSLGIRRPDQSAATRADCWHIAFWRGWRLNKTYHGPDTFRRHRSNDPTVFLHTSPKAPNTTQLEQK